MRSDTYDPRLLNPYNNRRKPPSGSSPLRRTKNELIKLHALSPLVARSLGQTAETAPVLPQEAAPPPRDRRTPQSPQLLAPLLLSPPRLMSLSTSNHQGRHCLSQGRGWTNPARLHQEKRTAQNVPASGYASQKGTPDSFCRLWSRMFHPREAVVLYRRYGELTLWRRQVRGRSEEGLI